MKNKLSLFIVCFATLFQQSVKAQCMLVPVELPELCAASESVIEGKISLLKTLVHSDNNVYSIYTIEVSSVYKGQLLDTIYLVSLGGQFGLHITQATPSDDLKNAFGLFFVKKAKVITHLIPTEKQFELTASTQGRIWLQNGLPDDVFHRYKSYQELKNKLMGITHLYHNVHQILPQNGVFSHKRATPNISAISPTTRNAGTDSIITITGTNFNSSRGSGFVQFRDADAGGASFIQPLATDFVSWSNTQIQVKVPTSAGTGTIRVFNSDPDSVLSSTSLTVPYNLINVIYNPGTGNTHYGTRLQGLNSGAKMLMTFNTRFNDSVQAKRDFVSSMETWRCKSLINWDTASSTSSTTAPANDGTHLVLWDFNSALSLGVLGVAISNFSGCISGPNVFFFVSDLDVIFNDIPYTGYKWEYGTGVPSSSQFDFESVALHELGHGHQLGHVIDASKVMHYSIGPAQRKNTISTQDSFGAKNIMAKNVVSICGQTAMTPLTSSNCSYVALPVDWLSFDAANTLNEIALNWKVVNENKVEKYLVMRSLDGFLFERVASINAMKGGQSANILTYDFFDRDVRALSHGAYYRIVSVDYDGQETSSIIQFVSPDKQTYFYAKIENGTVMLFSSLYLDKIEIKVFNTIGQEINYTKEDNLIVLKGLSKGVYYVQYVFGNGVQTQKIIIDE